MLIIWMQGYFFLDEVVYNCLVVKNQIVLRSQAGYTYPNT